MIVKKELVKTPSAKVSLKERNKELMIKYKYDGNNLDKYNNYYSTYTSENEEEYIDYSNMYFSTTPFTSASDTLTLVVKTDYTSIKLRGMSNLGDEWSGSGVTKTLEDIGNGWKTVTWTLSEIVGSNDVTTMNGFKIEGLVDGTDILMKDILINGQTDWVGEFASTYHGVVTQQQIEE